MYAVVKPVAASPKKMGPPEAEEPALCVVTKPGVMGEDRGVGRVLLPPPLVPEMGGVVEGARGRVSRERVRRQEARTKEKEAAVVGSWVDV